VVEGSDDCSANATLRILDRCASLSDGSALDESAADAFEFRFFLFFLREDWEIG